MGTDIYSRIFIYLFHSISILLFILMRSLKVFRG